MAKSKTYAVIGLGQFGQSVVEELVDNDADVIAIDKDPVVVEKVGAYLSTAFVADCTDEEALIDLGIKDVDVAVIAFGENREASVLTTVILKELGVKNIITRVDDDYYVNIFKRLGATEIISPQKAAGIALANRLGNDDLRDFYKLDSKYSIVSIVVKNNFKGQTLIQMNPKSNYGVNVVVILRNGKSFVPGGNDSILAGDTVFAVGTEKDMKAFRRAINGK